MYGQQAFFNVHARVSFQKLLKFMLKHSIIVSRVCGGARKIKLLDVVDFDMIMTHL